MTSLSTERLHATCVSIGGEGVLIEGLPGVGKSDLALRLIDRGAVLVSDDQTIITRDGERLVATAPPTIRGKLEVRGLGIVTMDVAEHAPVALIVSLSDEVPRLPLVDRIRRIAGIDIGVIAFSAFDASTPIKVELALGEARR